MHTQQGERETYQVEKRYGKRPIAWLKEIGFLDDTLIAVHLTDADDKEAKVVAESGANMILCPGSIGIIDGIVPPSTAFQEAGGKVALGSDQAPGNNCHNIINEMKLAALFNKIKYQNPEKIPAWKALRMATIEGAEAVGLGEITGSLEVGKKADFIAIDLNKPSMLPIYTKPMRNIVPNLVYSARGEEVSISVVDGKVIYRDGKILNINEKEVFQEINKYTDGIGERASKEFWEIDGTNAQFMKEHKL
jgi:5-methylthioadenosine/S-adenosylhomocysteine deaminase